MADIEILRQRRKEEGYSEEYLNKLAVPPSVDLDSDENVPVPIAVPQKGGLKIGGTEVVPPLKLDDFKYDVQEQLPEEGAVPPSSTVGEVLGEPISRPQSIPQETPEIVPVQDALFIEQAKATQKELQAVIAPYRAFLETAGIGPEVGAEVGRQIIKHDPSGLLTNLLDNPDQEASYINTANDINTKLITLLEARFPQYKGKIVATDSGQIALKVKQGGIIKDVELTPGFWDIMAEARYEIGGAIAGGTLGALAIQKGVGSKFADVAARTTSKVLSLASFGRFQHTTRFTKLVSDFVKNMLVGGTTSAAGAGIGAAFDFARQASTLGLSLRASAYAKVGLEAAAEDFVYTAIGTPVAAVVGKIWSRFAGKVPIPFLRWLIKDQDPNDSAIVKQLLIRSGLDPDDPEVRARVLEQYNATMKGYNPNVGERFLNRVPLVGKSQYARGLPSASTETAEQQADIHLHKARQLMQPGGTRAGITGQPEVLDKGPTDRLPPIGATDYADEKITGKALTTGEKAQRILAYEKVAVDMGRFFANNKAHTKQRLAEITKEIKDEKATINATEDKLKSKIAITPDEQDAYDNARLRLQELQREERLYRSETFFGPINTMLNVIDDTLNFRYLSAINPFAVFGDKKPVKDIPRALASGMASDSPGAVSSPLLTEAVNASGRTRVHFATFLKNASNELRTVIKGYSDNLGETVPNLLELRKGVVTSDRVHNTSAKLLSEVLKNLPGDKRLLAHTKVLGSDKIPDDVLAELSKNDTARNFVTSLVESITSGKLELHEAVFKNEGLKSFMYRELINKDKYKATREYLNNIGIRLDKELKTNSPGVLFSTVVEARENSRKLSSLVNSSLFKEIEKKIKANPDIDPKEIEKLIESSFLDTDKRNISEFIGLLPKKNQEEVVALIMDKSISRHTIRTPEGDEIIDFRGAYDELAKINTDLIKAPGARLRVQMMKEFAEVYGKGPEALVRDRVPLVPEGSVPRKPSPGIGIDFGFKTKLLIANTLFRIFREVSFGKLQIFKDEGVIKSLQSFLENPISVERSQRLFHIVQKIKEADKRAGRTGTNQELDAQFEHLDYFLKLYRSKAFDSPGSVGTDAS